MKCSNDTHDLNLFKLLHIVSPTLPVGAFSYSQTLEWWVEQGVVKDESSFIKWLSDFLLLGQFRSDLVFFNQAFTSIKTNDFNHFLEINSLYLSSRETSELRLESIQMGYSLLKLIPEITSLDLKLFPFDNKELGYPLVWVLLSYYCGLNNVTAQKGFLWSWLENIVMVGVKVIPLGQTAGQRILVKMIEILDLNLEKMISINNEDIPITTLPGLAIASSCHETQYTRLFRS
ncbi:urease accessory protein UreF [Ferrovum sp. PN-J185]|uniref:urease accessory protein UreF n=1 Tax=Ferrovum sp. PN-J185 TaxID=1356306 RepID=UPI00079C9861|nr:urease accessory protein UreF [Ferrovum sp. PN-J185]KXW56931.1 urease accessory protein UreF [Ferrovum sp. PN-J185]MCC6069196.1 urease accessory protein UreF [Ferrovum sp. PN-J185]MDE1892341.1 urease accessory protein UreF [Betaproteobacteria bacterium]